MHCQILRHVPSSATGRSARRQRAQRRLVFQMQILGDSMLFVGPAQVLLAEIDQFILQRHVHRAKGHFNVRAGRAGSNRLGDVLGY